MRSTGFLGTTLSTLLLTGIVLHSTGWFAARPAHPTASEARKTNLASSDAVWRWSHSHPTHWRGYILQH
jgi:hypothetical protein